MQELREMREKGDTMRKQLRAEQDHMLNLRNELSNITFQNIKFHEIIASISQSIVYMSDLKERWHQITVFFQKFSLLTNQTISEDIQHMVECVVCVVFIKIFKLSTWKSALQSLFS